MHTALLVNSALNIKTKNMGTEESKSAFNGCCNDKSLDVKPTDCEPGKNKIKNLSAVVAVQDDDGHWYVIPKELHEEFSEMLEASTMDFGASEEDVEAHYKAEEDFIEKFSQYMTGGDLNIVQLYAEI